MAAVLLLIAVAAATTRLIEATAPALDLPLAGRLALLPFVDATAEADGGWLEAGLSEMVAETVAYTAGPALLTPERLLEVLEPRGLDLGDPAAREQARRLALGAGADQVLDAAVRRDGDGIAIEVELFGAEARVGAGQVSGRDALDAADALAFALARGLSSDVEPRRLGRFFSRSPFLDRLYGTGVAELRAAGPEAARGYFEIALRQQPGFLRARERLAECALLSGEAERARQLAREALEEARSLGEHAVEARALDVLARAQALAGELDQAAATWGQASELYLAAGDRPAQADVLFELARLALAGGEAARAEAFYVDRLRLQQELGDRLGEIDTLYQIGSLLLAGRDFEGAEQVLADARELAVATGDVWAEMRLAASLGETAIHRGDVAAAQKHWRRALDFYRQERQQEGPRRLLLSYKLAESLVMTGELDEAEDRLHDLLELATELDNRPYQARASLGLAWLMLRTGYPYQAKPHLDRALELDRWLDDRVLLQQVIAWYAYEQGNYRLALDTQQDVKRQGRKWTAVDESFLQVYRQAEVLGRRLPLPGEDDYVDPAAG